MFDTTKLTTLKLETLNLKLKLMKDLFGKAILDFQTNNNPQDLITETSISEADEMSVAYLFRVYKEMPKLEQQALALAKGKILDVGCGAGSHSLYLQNEKNCDVTAIDISSNAIEACLLRGIHKTKVQDVMTLHDEKFDTILLLMNGAGMCGRLKNVAPFLLKLKSLLNENGQRDNIVQTVFTIRNRYDINFSVKDNFIKYNGLTYNIDSILNLDLNNIDIEIVASQRT